MDLRAVTRSLGPIDLRSIRRDSLLSWMILMPFVITLVLRLGLPLVQSWIFELTEFDLRPYYPLILAVYLVLLTPMLFGMLVGFLLLDERDNETLTALQVTPLPMTTYIAYRLLIPMILSFILTFLMYPLVNIAQLDWADLVLMAVTAAPAGPLLALFIAGFAENKVQGFALLKGLGGVLMLPVLAFFVPGKAQLLFGVLPTYWPIKVYWLLEANQGDPWSFILVGLLYQLVLIGILLRRFSRVLHR
jgi:fluoroquinolone transport system permease protein